MIKEPDKLIESNGYIYKLLKSKEEQQKIDKIKEEERLRALGAFKQKIGKDIYEYLKSNELILSYRTGGNYSVEVSFDFKNEETWTSDDYSSSEKKNFGDTDWFTYDKTELNNQFVSAPIHKMISDYLFNKLTTTK